MQMGECVNELVRMDELVRESEIEDRRVCE